MGTGMGTMPWVWIRVRVLHAKKSLVQVRDHGYRYTLSFPDKYGYGYGKGYYKSAKLGPLTAVIEKPGYRFVHEGRPCRINF